MPVTIIPHRRRVRARFDIEWDSLRLKTQYIIRTNAHDYHPSPSSSSRVHRARRRPSRARSTRAIGFVLVLVFASFVARTLYYAHLSRASRLSRRAIARSLARSIAHSLALDRTSLIGASHSFALHRRTRCDARKAIAIARERDRKRRARACSTSEARARVRARVERDRASESHGVRRAARDDDDEDVGDE